MRSLERARCLPLALGMCRERETSYRADRHALQPRTCMHMLGNECLPACWVELATALMPSSSPCPCRSDAGSRLCPSDCWVLSTTQAGPRRA